ncbi:ion transporter [Sphingomonas sp. LHG3406-1]|uniref:ion transporter n=1 Tax=Sphingomonas sp. LHG3406-1 TaxID=2804617 RepID=UPI0026051EDB|nr:ion transporter [Sphingomonas sp. LHG3406-1]
MASAAERWSVLEELDEWLRLPMALLGLAWLLIVVAELLWGENALLSLASTAVWVIFIAEFALRLLLSPDRSSFLRRNWLTIFALVVPALRFFRALAVLRAARGLRALRLVRIVGTANRSMNALRITMRRRRFGYVLGLTILVIVLGAAGMLSFEPVEEVEGGFTSYGHALWWTAMLVTSIGSDFWPLTTEGRALALLLSIYGLAVFGYITASFASFFIGRDASEADAPLAGSADIARLADEIRELRLQLSHLG